MIVIDEGCALDNRGTREGRGGKRRVDVCDGQSREWLNSVFKLSLCQSKYIFIAQHRYLISGAPSKLSPVLYLLYAAVWYQAP